MRKLFIAFVIVLSFVGQAMAVNPDEVLDDPALEQRARDLSIEIRCLVCQNQSIDDSDAELARDLRILVREKLTEGLTDRQILDFLVERYGEFVLLKPPFNSRTVLLWGLPLLVLLIGAFVAWKTFGSATRQKVSGNAKLDREEQEKLSKILDN